MIMNQIELFNWAYENYKKEFINNRDDYLFKKGINSKKYPKDVLTMIEVTCIIKDDWIEAIEKGLVYIAKAIKEDRQFIRNDGEVLPIEKIRRVSKDSISDLSKHSNYITKVPEEETENVIPEKLLMIQRENDYSIYENRVVYTTLCYLKEFVSSRLEKIKEATNKYEGTCYIKKSVDLGYRTFDFTLDLRDVRKNDPIALKRNEAFSKIERLDTILNDILILLNTTLMVEVSKAPLVTRPVTKTNVLKMNTNFKESLAVFDYVCGYNEPGYEIKEEIKEIKPLSTEQENSFNDVIQLSSFLTYVYNNHLEDELKEAYLEEEKRREEEKEKETLARIKELLDKAKRSGKETNEFILLLVEGYKILNKKIDALKKELATIIEEYEQKIVEIKLAHEAEINALNEQHAEEINRIQEEHAEEIRLLNEQHGEEINALHAEYSQKIEDIKNEHFAIVSEKDSQISKLNENLSNLEKEFEESKAKHLKEIRQKQKEINFANAELKAMKMINKSEKYDPKDFTSRARFDELEAEKEALDEFFKIAWKETKKDIKKTHFVPLKNKKGEDK